ncbi:MAG: hypothetical protein QXQ18_00410 [Candidatus Aenigmatarchaeota archaeon]
MLTKEEIEEKLEKGWIKSRLWFEVMSTDKTLTEKTLKEHIEKLKKEKFTIVINERYEKVEEVEKPRQNLEKAYSQAVEVEILTKDIETLLFDVIFFAPSAVEILEPKELKVGIDTLQTIMNSVADILHRFASVGGGIIISTKK